MDNCAKVHKKTATSNFYYLSLSKQVMLFLMMKKIFYTTSILFFLLLGGLYFASDFMFDYSLRRSEEHTSELQSRQYLVCRLLLEKKRSVKQGLRVDLYLNMT